MSLKLRLNVIWRKTFLGLSIDKLNTKINVPITSYYLWPRTDAWEQLKIELDSKKWIPDPDKIRTLNYASNLINYWRKNRNNVLNDNIYVRYPDLFFVGIKNLGL